MSEYIDTFTVLITVLLVLNCVKINALDTRSIYYLIFVFLYVCPIMLDVFYKKPDYSSSIKNYGFDISSTDETTRIFYDLLLIYSQLIYLRFTKGNITTRNLICNTNEDEIIRSNIKQEEIIKIISFFFALLPAILTILFQFNILIIFTPLWRERITLDLNNYSILDKLSYVGVLSSILLYFLTDNNRNFGLQRIFALIFLYINMCIEGKRSIIFFIMITFIISLILKGNKKETTKKISYFKTLMLIGTIILMLYFVVWFSVFVKTTSRGYDVDNYEKMYTAIRIDIFRENRIMMELFSLNNPKIMSIVDAFGITLIQVPLFFFPIDIFRSYFFHYSPITYTAYISAALIDNPFPSTVDAFMTPCIWGEIISNFNWLGVIFSPFFFVIFSRITEKLKYPYNFILIVCFIAINMYSLAYMSYLLEFAIIIFLVKETQKHPEHIKRH